MMKYPWLLLLALGGTLLCPSVWAGDWPMARHDAGRGNSTPHALPKELHLQWVRQLPPAQPAWPEEQARLQYDTVPQPIVLGKRLFAPSTTTDGLTAYDTESGRHLWHFATEGPVRLAPVAYKRWVYVAADDGYLYCLNAADGKLCWKVNGGPAERWLIGNHRLISTWPVRGGPVLHQGRIYFAAGIWPFMGIFVHAVDPETGALLWTNSGDGSNFIVHPHNAPAFGGVAPQGHLAATGNFLIVPGGRSTPAVFDTRTGKLVHFAFDGRNGGCQVVAGKQIYYIGGQAYLAKDGTRLGWSDPALLDERLLISLDKQDTIRGETPAPAIKNSVKVDRKGKEVRVASLVRQPLFELSLEGSAGDVLLKAGNRLYTGGAGAITAFDLGDQPTDGSRRAVWSAQIEGEVHHMLAGDDRLFVVTTDARLYCFGAKSAEPVVHAWKTAPLPETKDAWTGKAAEILKNKGATEGYAVVLGLGTGRLAEELLRQSQVYVIAVDPDPDRVAAFRRRMQTAGLYGQRVEAHVGNPATFTLPKYLANLIVVDTANTLEFCRNRELVQRTFAVLRPYGGLLCLELPPEKQAAFSALVRGLNDPQSQVRRTGPFTVLVRAGPLPDSGDWTHQYANAAQTAVSRDKRVKAPLGLLWFGGPPHKGILPRHGHGPSPQVAGGRLFIEGPDQLRAVDVYTGRLLWERRLKDFGKYYNIIWHFPGAGEIGSNYVSLPEQVYAVHGSALLELDAVNGRTLRRFQLPAEPNKEPPSFGFLAVSGDLLIATAGPVPIELPSLFKFKVKSKDDADDDPGRPAKKSRCGEPEEGGDGTDKKEPEAPSQRLADLPPGKYASGSRRLAVFDRRTGALLWTRDAEYTFRHNNIAIGGDKIFCIDSITEEQKKVLGRRGISFPGKPALYALDAHTGKVVWKTTEPVFGTFLNYAEEHDVLLEAGSTYRDRAGDEVKKGMAAFRGKDGELLWHKATITYGGPCLLWRDQVLTNGLEGFALELLTGKATGWKYGRKYGCNTVIGSEYLLTFRSGCAGFYDLENFSGTGNIGGFRSSCTSNLIVADGVLNAPDYTRSCTCTYQNQCSLALIHMPEAEFWTFGGVANTARIGLNFGAPGDRRAPDGTLWQAKGKVKMEPADLKTFRLHSSLVAGVEPHWVTASGFLGAERITIPVSAGKTYRVKCYFLEPEPLAAGQRVFDVKIQGRTVLEKLDVVQAAGGSRRGLVRAFTVTAVRGEIVLELVSRTPLPAAISGVEVIQERDEG